MEHRTRATIRQPTPKHEGRGMFQRAARELEFIKKFTASSRISACHAAVRAVVCAALQTPHQMRRDMKDCCLCVTVALSVHDGMHC
jgi:hypothetical protein